MSDDAAHRLTRRAFLSIIAAAGAAACSGTVTITRSPSPSPSPSDVGVASSPAPLRTARSSPPPDMTGTFEPFAGETYPNAKRVAGRFVEHLTTYDADADLRSLVQDAARTADRRFDVDAVVRRSRPLFARGGQSRGEVVYPQLGGLTIGSGVDRASMMVVVRQTGVDANGDDFSVTRAVDVRLINRSDLWEVEDLADAGGRPVAAPAPGLPEVARRVLEDPRIDLPDSARWDILRGGMDERLLATMIDLAAVAPYSVCVLRSGHPRKVFGTDLVSGHTLGLAVDIWQLAGTPIVLQQPDTSSDAHEFVEAALHDLEVPELGSPWDLDGPPEPGETKPSFTDAVHADHIHIAFKAV